MLNRRGFLAGILATAAAPAIVRAGTLMPVRPLADELVVVPFTYVGYDLVDIIGDVEEMREELCGVRLISGEIGQLDRFTIITTPCVAPPMRRTFAKVRPYWVRGRWA